MKLVNKFILKNGDVAVIIDDDGVKYNALVRGLYDETILHSLIESGYKFYDYNGKIELPDGRSIYELEEVTIELSEYEEQMMYDACDYTLSEAEASKFFIRESTTAVSFMEPVEIIIHNREELIKYINDNYYYYNSHDIRDVRPINAITAPEALFEISELMNDRELCNKFTVMLKNRMTLNINEWEDLMRFFNSVSDGKIDFLSDSVTQADIINAYCAWGLSGIKTTVVSTSSIVNDSTNIYSNDDAEMRIPQICYLSNIGDLYYPNGHIANVTNQQYEDLRVQPNMKEYMHAMDKHSEWTSEGLPIRCMSKHEEPRLKWQLIDKSGITFNVKISPTATVVRDLNGVIYTHEMFSILDAYDTPTGLDMIYNRESYSIFNIMKAKAFELLTGKVIKHRYKSSYSMCIQEGLSPEGALKYIAGRISSGYGANEELGDATDMLGIAEVFRYIKPEYINKYNPAQVDYDNVFELIDIMRQSFEDTQEEDDNSIVVSSAELRERPVERLTIAKSIIVGDTVIDDARLGRASDIGLSIVSSISLLYSVARYELSDITYDNVFELLQSSRLYELIDVNKVFRIKDAEFAGMNKDISRLRNDMATQAGQIIYINRVYREISNDEPDNQRHYLFECLEFDALSKYGENLFNRLTSCVKVAIENKKDEFADELDNLILQAPYIAASVLFKLVIDKNALKVVEIPFNDTTISVAVTDEIYDSLHYNREGISIKFSTLCDFCTYDVSQNGNICIFCVNANITPWYVTPKHGYTIPEYNFTLNYILPDVLNRFSAEYRNKVSSTKAKVRTLSNQFSGNALYSYDLSSLVSVDYTLDTIDTVLNYNNDEFPNDYYKRFMLYNAKYNKSGKYVKTLKLRSDSVFCNYATVCNSKYVDETEYDDINVGDSKLMLKYIDVVNLSERVGISESKSYKTNVTRFVLEDEKMQDVSRWTAILNGTIEFKAFVIYGGSEFIFVYDGGQERYSINELTVDFCNKLCDRGFLYQLNSSRYLLCTGFSFLSLEVW